MSYEYAPLVCSIDIGTTSTRVIMFDRRGQEVTKHQIEYSTSAQEGSKRNSPTIFTNEGIAIDLANDSTIELEEDMSRPTLSFPQPGWVECDPCHILANVIQCLAVCMTNIEIMNSDEPLDGSEPTWYHVVSIGIANMRETTIIWSKATGKPLHPGIVWNDTRTLPLMHQAMESTPDDVLAKLQDKSGCPISTYFSSLKWIWLYQNVPEIRASYDSGECDLMFGTIDTWLIYNITKEKSFYTDITNASRTSFMDLERRDYDKYLLDYWNVDPAKINLPKIVPSSFLYGTFELPDLSKIGYKRKYLSDDAAECLARMLNETPIAGCLGDQSASLVGQLALKKGDAKCTYGTGAFLLYNTGNKKLVSKHGAVTTVGYWFPSLKDDVDGEGSNDPQYCLEGSIAVAGSMVQWLRDNLKMIGKASDIGPLAAQVPNSAGVVFVPAFSGLFAPYWDSKTTGTIFGLTQYSSASHIARAAIEGVCFQVRAILKAMVSDAGCSSDFLDDRNLKNPDNPLNTLHVDGGMSKSSTVMQIQADILGPCVSVVRSTNAECTALGSAIAAGLCDGVGMWSSLGDVVESVSGSASSEEEERNHFVAAMGDKKRRKFWRLWERAVERAQGWLEPPMSDEE